MNSIYQLILFPRYFNLVAEDQAIDDVVYQLEKALLTGVIDLPAFIKVSFCIMSFIRTYGVLLDSSLKQDTC